MSFAAKAVAGGVLAVLGLMVARFVFGLFGAALAFLMFVLLKVVPLVLLGIVVVWAFKRLTRDKETTV